MTYKGKERRKLLNVRRIIDAQMKPSKEVMKKMARMLGQDKLAKIDSKLFEHYGENSHEVQRRIMNGMSPRGATAAIHSLKRRADETEPKILEAKLDLYPFSKKVKKSLDSAGIVTIGDFIMKTKEELREKGLSKKATKEVTEVLLERGIRTIDNPPTTSS